jgi:hypothetical protein
MEKTIARAGWGVGLLLTPHLLYSATTQMLSEWLLKTGVYMHWMPA